MLTLHSGLEAVTRLAEHNAKVYLCARSIERATTAIQGAITKYPEAKIEIIQMDHLNFASVKEAAESIVSKTQELHGLVNNAGIMATPFEFSNDGFETQWQTNYLSHWLFTAKLVPLLQKTSQGQAPGSVRIVNLSSEGHRQARACGINFDDTSLKDGGRLERYGQSKLANILHARTLHQKYGPGSDSAKKGNGEIWVTSAHPGVIATNLLAATKLPWFVMGPINFLSSLGMTSTVDVGARPTLFCAASPEMKVEQSGRYFDKLNDRASESALAKDEGLAKRLDEWTVKVMAEKGYAV